MNIPSWQRNNQTKSNLVSLGDNTTFKHLKHSGCSLIGRELVILRSGYYLLNYGITPANDDAQLVLFVDGAAILHAGTNGSKILRLQSGSRLAIGAASATGSVTLADNGVNAYLTVTPILAT